MKISKKYLHYPCKPNLEGAFFTGTLSLQNMVIMHNLIHCFKAKTTRVAFFIAFIVRGKANLTNYFVRPPRSTCFHLKHIVNAVTGVALLPGASSFILLTIYKYSFLTPSLMLTCNIRIFRLIIVNKSQQMFKNQANLLLKQNFCGFKIA